MRSLKQMSYELPFKKLILGIYLRIRRSDISRKLLVKLSIQSYKNLRIGPFKLAIELTRKISPENTQKTCFSHKINLKNSEKHK